MRQKKDPGVRQEAFIRAATELFAEKGFEAVSVRDVLDAVGDKTASPSVFYYYFRSKDELYRVCVNALAQNYLASMGEGFSMEGRTVGEWMVSLVSCMESYLQSEKNLIMTGDSTPNRLFILDMRDQVTKQISAMWADTLSSFPEVKEGDERGLAQFLSGGISEMMFSSIFENGTDQSAVRKLSESVVRLCMNTIGLPEEQKEQLLNMLSELHKDRKISSKKGEVQGNE